MCTQCDDWYTARFIIPYHYSVYTSRWLIYSPFHNSLLLLCIYISRWLTYSLFHNSLPLLCVHIKMIDLQPILQFPTVTLCTHQYDWYTVPPSQIFRHLRTEIPFLVVSHSKDGHLIKGRKIWMLKLASSNNIASNYGCQK